MLCPRILRSNPGCVWRFRVMVTWCDVTPNAVIGVQAVAELLTTDKLSELACVTLYMMYEKMNGDKSRWHHFIKELDRQAAFCSCSISLPHQFIPLTPSLLQFGDDGPERDSSGLTEVLRPRTQIRPAGGVGDGILCYFTDCQQTSFGMRRKAQPHQEASTLPPFYLAVVANMRKWATSNAVAQRRIVTSGAVLCS